MAWLTRKGPNSKITDMDIGWSLGAGVGLMIPLNAKMVITAEYELAYASNSLYLDGLVNSAMAGLRFALQGRLADPRAIFGPLWSPP